VPIALIYARSENYCIGRNGQLPWHLPDEFEHFNSTTRDAAIIMGRKTYEDHSCELADRFNIVITRQESYPLAKGVHRAGSLQSALGLAREAYDRVFVIGGAGCLRDALSMSDTVYETVVHAEIPGDTFVDAFDFEGWRTLSLVEHPQDEAHIYGFSIYKYQRSILLKTG